MISVPFVPDTVVILGVEVPGFALVIFGAAGLLAMCGFCCVIYYGPDDPPTSESFRWPSSSRFLKKVDPRHPPKLYVNKYEDPVRSDVLVLDEEAKWTVTYQPRGGRHEVVQHMYLRFREGAVYGVGFEEGRKACKISGKYKRNEGANQMAVVVTCRFSNEFDTVMFHGSGNGTGLVGNCYVRELDRFSSFSSLPGLRKMGATKYKASFLMVKMEDMGDPHLRARLHTSRVQEWAGNLYPDDAMPLPASNKRFPGGAERGDATSPGAEPFVSNEDLGGIGGPRATSSTNSTRRTLSRRLGQGSDSVVSGGGGGSGSGGMSMKKVLGYFPRFGRRRARSSAPPRPTPPASAHSTTSTNELPPWVLQGGETGSTRGGGGGGGGGGGRTDSSSGKGYTYSMAPSSAAPPPRPSLQPSNPYLPDDAIPGRSMV